MVVGCGLEVWFYNSVVEFLNFLLMLCLIGCLIVMLRFVLFICGCWSVCFVA